ncbi:MAG: hypothetical protein AUI15_12630 [Actinobacteria bacterium 13_2_20CM_2_66_6]|nr:MAG: hypothetical protein AUI15_12630 [Actinobacteria bacterium 13_2_20CM_2_66_6]
MPIRVVAFDGDDTLWHNETHFNFTQAALRDLLRGHAPNADVDARLFETEMANLSLYGYGIKSFTLSMIETALEITDGTIPASDLKVILDWGKRMLREPTELLEGVRETLLGMSQNHQLLLITKGDLFDQESKLARSGLAERFPHPVPRDLAARAGRRGFGAWRRLVQARQDHRAGPPAGLAGWAAKPVCPPQATISAGPENEEGLNPRGRPSLIGLAL